MTIHLLARHFRYSSFMQSDYCPIANAIKEAIPGSSPLVGFSFVYIDGEKFFLSEPYHQPDHEIDSNIARRGLYGQTLIRQIKLNKYEKET